MAKIIVQFDYGNSIELMNRSSETITDTLDRAGVQLRMDCGGNGTCGKCRIRVIKGSLSVTEEDKNLFSQQELQAGWRIACKAKVINDLIIAVPCDGKTPKKETMQALAVNVKYKSDTGSKSNSSNVAIDIGTTTIAMALLDKTTGVVIAATTMVNSQCRYGSDVLSRIYMANHGMAEELKRLLWKDLLNGVDALLEQTKYFFKVKKIIIAGNTTMEHILMGDSCAKLGESPFTPVTLELRNVKLEEILPQVSDEKKKIEVTILPGISAFVGADVVAGLLACNFDKIEKPSLLIDLGTNGEMVLGTKERLLVTSTAAGPAFEGGNITCGMGSITGAICSVQMIQQKTHIVTIGEKPPVGVCGTGVLELVYELLKSGKMDESGLLREEYQSNGYLVAEKNDGQPIVFTQKDIREFQMAKSAIRSGIEILLEHYGITQQEVDTVYLAGGFGYKLNRHKAAGVGLIPRIWKDRTIAVGNTSLQGAINYLCKEKAVNRCMNLIAATEEISLAKDEKFENLYLKNMYLK